jgi:hypothetical protein
MTTSPMNSPDLSGLSQAELLATSLLQNILAERGAERMLELFLRLVRGDQTNFSPEQLHQIENLAKLPADQLQRILTPLDYPIPAAECVPISEALARQNQTPPQ